MVRLTVWPPDPTAVTALLPYVSYICTVIVPEGKPAATVWSATLKPSATGAAGLTVSCCTCEVRPAAEAVSVGVPATVSL